MENMRYKSLKMRPNRVKILKIFPGIRKSVKSIASSVFGTENICNGEIFVPKRMENLRYKSHIVRPSRDKFWEFFGRNFPLSWYGGQVLQLNSPAFTYESDFIIYASDINLTDNSMYIQR